MKKSQTQILSVLFHLAVLACMVVVYDAGKLLIGKYKTVASEMVKSVDQKNGKGNAKSPTGGTDMEDLMKQKKDREMEKKAGMAKGTEAKKEQAESKPQGKGNANAPAGATTMADLMKQKAQRQTEKTDKSE